MNDLQPLDEFIQEHFKTKAEFARKVGIFPQHVTQWLNAGYVVHDGKMYREMRDFTDLVKS